jgi:uncharacterized protein
MRLSSEFAVPATPGRVFPLFLDADVMRSCIPGCEELVRVDETTFRGRLVNVVAHVRFNAAFTVTLQAVEEPSRVQALLKGEDNRLGSSVNVGAELRVRPDGDGSLVGYEMDLALWGKIGRLGESIVRRRTAEVEAQFVTSFTAAVTDAGAAAPAVESPAPLPPPSAVATQERVPATAAAQQPSGPPARGLWSRLVAWWRGLFGGRS